MRATFTLLVVLFASFYCTEAAELVLNGVYKGKDIYVQNPYSKEAGDFCTEEVYVNDEQVIVSPRTTAYKISLAHLNLRDIVVIRIVYREGCTPRIVNPEVIQPINGFKFLTAQAERNSVSWLTRGELPGGIFYIERLVTDEEWQTVKEYSALGQQANSYQVPVSHRGGENIYRIRYRSDDSNDFYSVTFTYDFKEAPITFYPKEADNKLYLSAEAEYLIVDAYGRKYKRGKGRIITIHNLKPGEYFLVIQERSEPFVKKQP